MRKYSQNFESSFFFQKLGLGGVASADLIFEKQFVPRSLKVNLSVPLSDSEFQLMEFGLRQVGLESEIQSMVDQMMTGSKSTPEIFRKLSEFFSGDSDDQNEINRNNRFSRAARSSYWSSTKDSREIRRPEASAYVAFDGKTVAYVDLMDAEQTDMRSLFKNLPQKMQMFRDHHMTQDRAYAAMISFGHSQLGLNATVVMGYKGDEKSFWPSIAAELTGQTANNRIIQRVSSAPAIQFDLQKSSDNKKVKITYSLPKDQLNLLSVSSQVIQYDDAGHEKQVKTDVRKSKGCTAGLTRFLGIELCSKLSMPKSFLSSPIPVMNVEFSLKKTDRYMSGWEYSAEYDDETYRASFNTPGSKLDREISVQVDLKKQSADERKVRIQLKTPFKSVETTSSYKWSETEVNVLCEATVDRKDRYVLEAGMEQEASGNRKSTWKPKLRIESPVHRPIVLGGSVMVDQGRKSQVAFDLHNSVDDSQKQYLKGSLVKEGSVSVSNNFKLSSDLQADFGIMAFRIFGTAENQEKSVSTDMKIEYQTPNSRKENFKFIGKLQNLSTATLAKVNSFVEVQMTEYPEKNFHLSWNVLRKPQEHLENEVTLMWRDQMRDPKRRIHLLQG